MSQNHFHHSAASPLEKEEIAFGNLIQYFSEQGTLSKTDEQLIRQYGTYKTVLRGTFLHKEGTITNDTFFVVKGLFRLFSRNYEGEEINLQFSAETYWVNDYESYLSGKSSDNNLEALEDSEVIAFKKEDLNDLLQNSPTIYHLVEKLTEKNTLYNRTRLMHQIKDSPQKRYEDFVAQFTDIYNRIPLYMLASYLGISRKTLTRIRGGK